MLPLRDENPVHRVPLVTLALIGLCTAVYFFAQLGHAGVEQLDVAGETVTIDGDLRFSLTYAAIPCEITRGRPLTLNEIERTFGLGEGSACLDNAAVGDSAAVLAPDKSVLLSMISSMFLHGSIAHLALNLLFLWIFGNNIEDRLGHVAFLLFYFGGGIAATVGHIASQPASTVPVVGASGAIAAVMGAYLVWFPNAPIRTVLFLILVDIRARWFLLGWFVLQFFTSPDDGVAWVAHVVGFAYGVGMGLVVRRRSWDPTGGAGRGPYPHPSDYLPGVGPPTPDRRSATDRWTGEG